MRVGESPLFCWISAHFGTMREAVASKIEEIAQRVAESEGMELVEVEVKGGGSAPLRAHFDRQAGRRHPRRLRAGFAAGGDHSGCGRRGPGRRYTLEVSSPAWNVSSSKPQDYQRFQGKKAKITLREPVEGRRNWEGTLAGFDGRRHRARNRARARPCGSRSSRCRRPI